MTHQRLNADEWLAELFEFEYCAECEGDAQHHTVCGGPFGNFFARCDFPMSAETNWERHPVIAAYRKVNDALEREKYPAEDE